MRFCLLALIAACFQPTLPEGAVCATSADCPGTQMCFANVCRSEAPDDPPPPGDAPVVPPDPCVDALWCDDFESGDLGAWTISRSVMNATVEVTQTQAHAGTRSLEANVPAQGASGASAYVRATSAPLSTGVLAARAWILAPAVIEDFAGVLRFGGDDRYVIVVGDGNEHWAVTENSSAGLFDHSSEMFAEPNRWTCVELVYTLTQPRIQLYIDGMMVVDVAAEDPAPVFSELGAGVTRAPVNGFRVFVDDLVIANQRIGCE